MQSALLESEDRRKELETGIDVIQTTLRRTMKERDAARDEAQSSRLARLNGDCRPGEPNAPRRHRTHARFPDRRPAYRRRSARHHGRRRRRGQADRQGPGGRTPDHREERNDQHLQPARRRGQRLAGAARQDVPRRRPADRLDPGHRAPRLFRPGRPADAADRSRPRAKNPTPTACAPIPSWKRWTG